MHIGTTKSIFLFREHLAFIFVFVINIPMEKTLLVIVGPTAVGKTETALRVAEQLHCQIISADSRQVYRELKIGTASPTTEQMARVPHHLVGHRSVTDYYSAYEFEQDVLALLEKLFVTNDVVLLTGGSMMYVDAVCNGIDQIPTISDEVRKQVWTDYEHNGLEYMLGELQRLDPEHYNIVDKQNYKRVLHAIEVCLQSGQTYTSLRTNSKVERQFRIIRVAICRERQELFDRIGQRVDEMIRSGLEEEVRQCLPMRHLNSLNTVGYKEMFDYIDGKMTITEAVEKIKTNTRRYAKKQMTWFKSKGEYVWFDATDELLVDKIISLLEK